MFDSLCHVLRVRRFAATAMDLRKPRYSRLDVVAHRIVLDDPTVLRIMGNRMGTRPDQRHFTFDDIHQLRQFVDAAPPQNTAYPGDADVNYVTNDFYDQSWDGSCGIPYNGSNFTASQEACLWSRDFNPLLGRLTSFASGHSKPLGIGEFGVINRSDGHGGGDDPTFISSFSTWLRANNVAWASYFNCNSGGNSILSDYPNSLAAYQSDLG